MADNFEFSSEDLEQLGLFTNPDNWANRQWTTTTFALPLLNLPSDVGDKLDPVYPDWMGQSFTQEEGTLTENVPVGPDQALQRAPSLPYGDQFLVFADLVKVDSSQELLSQHLLFGYLLMWDGAAELLPILVSAIIFIINTALMEYYPKDTTKQGQVCIWIIPAHLLLPIQ